MRIVVTGADGFVGKNLRVRLSECGYDDVVSVTRSTPEVEALDALGTSDFVFHLAGVNRPLRVDEFETGNVGVTEWLSEVLRGTGRPVPVVLSSSTQALLDNPYGRSKRAAEEVLLQYARESGAPVYLLRLTNVFGKWCRPNYNSAVATFCHNLTRGLPVTVHDASAPLTLLYIDDAVSAMLRLLDGASRPGYVDVGPTYATTVGEVVSVLESFADSRRTLVVPEVGTGLTRALYATYLSYLPPTDFAYGLRRHTDPRGVFVEMLKTRASGQVSYFTAPPGVTRGEHYHHTKTEKFLVVKGKARFGFRHVATGETHEVLVEGEAAQVVETVPGWVHNITNVGDEEMVVMLWANEIFDPERPDTIAARVEA
jgi:UDP-2-acetamido-2,6-beta-L-arabino-hexul-4-ose reductase